MASKFERCLGVIRIVEGGYADVPGDHGGPTNYGVTQATYDQYCDLRGLRRQPIRLISPDEVWDVYNYLYWTPIRGDELSPSVALVLFDGAVHSGPYRAICMLQKVLGVVVDGIFGPQTLRATARLDHKTLITSYLQHRYTHLMQLADQPSQQKFRRGWQRRILIVKKYALEWLREVSP